MRRGAEYGHEDYPPPPHSYFATLSHQSSYQDNEVIISDECYFSNLIMTIFLGRLDEIQELLETI